jgi:hypothetical protein
METGLGWLIIVILIPMLAISIHAVIEHVWRDPSGRRVILALLGWLVALTIGYSLHPNVGRALLFAPLLVGMGWEVRNSEQQRRHRRGQLRLAQWEQLHRQHPRSRSRSRPRP